GLTPTSPTTVISTTTVTTGQWYHVAAVKSSSGFLLYVNGILEALKPLTVFNDTNSADVQLGYNIGYGARLNGLLDDVAIYRRALTSSEIQVIYNAGGGTKLGTGNANGIELDSNAAGNVIQGNYIGTNATGTAALGNSQYGVYLNGASVNSILGNTISGNA